MLFIKRSAGFVALLVAGLVALAIACGGETVEPGAPQQPEEPAPAATAMPAEPAMPAATAMPAMSAKPAATAMPAVTAMPSKPEDGMMMKPEGGGTLVVGMTKVDPPIFLPSQSAFSSAVFNASSGVFESLVRYTYAEPPELGFESSEGIATEWVYDIPSQTITYTIRDGVMFHGGWGELTAEDVAFSFNDAIRDDSNFGRAGELKRYMDRWEVIDKNTVVLHLKDVIDPNWWQAQAQTNGNHVPLVSKKFYEDNGEAAAVTSNIATGPFEVRSWTGGEELIADAVKDHWRGGPIIDSVRYVELPEESTQRAAFETGDVHIIRPSLKFIKPTLEAVPGAYTVQTDRGTGQSIIFSGNYYARIWPDTGETIWPRDGFKPDADHPWIGNPENLEQYEQARNIRWALAMAIDRELVNDVALDGLGFPTYTNSGFLPGDPGWQDEWFIPYDTARAKEMLAGAGYPDCFPMVLQIAPDLPSLITPDVGNVVAQMWTELGCDIEISNVAYSANRPRLVDRSMDNPWLMQSESYGFLYASKFHSMVPSAGFNYGIELPNNVAQPWYDNREIVSESQLIQNNAEVQEWVSHARLVAPIVQRVLFWTVRPEVLDWKPHFGGFNSPETVVLQQ